MPNISGTLDNIAEIWANAAGFATAAVGSRVPIRSQLQKLVQWLQLLQFSTPQNPICRVVSHCYVGLGKTSTITDTIYFIEGASSVSGAADQNKVGV